MSTLNDFDGQSTTTEVCDTALLSAIPILPGGMIDIALSELGATIVDVCLLEDEAPLLLVETE